MRISFSPHAHALQLAEGILVRQDRAFTVEKAGQPCKAAVTNVCRLSAGLCKPAVSLLHVPKATENQT